MSSPAEMAKKLSGDFEDLIANYKDVIRMLVGGLDAKTPQAERDAKAKSVESIIKSK